MLCSQSGQLIVLTVLKPPSEKTHFFWTNHWTLHPSLVAWSSLGLYMLIYWRWHVHLCMYMYMYMYTYMYTYMYMYMYMYSVHVCGPFQGHGIRVLHVHFRLTIKWLKMVASAPLIRLVLHAMMKVNIKGTTSPRTTGHGIGVLVFVNSVTGNNIPHDKVILSLLLHKWASKFQSLLLILN